GPPGFNIGNVYVMAGIPHVMRAMLATLESKLVGGAVVQSRSVTVYLGESAIAEQLRRLQAEYPNVDLGSYPFTREGRFGTTLVARSTNVQQLDEVLTKLNAMIIEAGGEPQLS
ncbi:MAG TPA: hypothetical protein VNA21_01970, partial [Steroidobacteraceae bacterium]|nr:hypothetical protein [Steroidobacteraceae bacterium]